MSQTKPSESGRSWLALLLIAAIAGILAAMLFPPLGRSRESALRSTCTHNEKMIGLAMKRYAKDHDDKLPNSLSELRPYVEDVRIFVCPSARDKTNPSYEIIAGGSKLGDVIRTAHTVLLRENPTNHFSGGHVLLSDGNVQWIPVSATPNNR